MSFALSPVNVRRRPLAARSVTRISETNDTKTDCIIAQLSPFTAARPHGSDGSVLTPAVSPTRVAFAPGRPSRAIVGINWRGGGDVSSAGLAAAAANGEF